jgi:hypothetical protein
MKVTTIIPEALIPAVNHTYFLLGMSPGVESHTRATWQDGQGNLYAVSSGEWIEAQLGGVAQVAGAVQGGADASQVVAGFDLYPAFHAAYGDEGVALVGDAAGAALIWETGGPSFTASPARVLILSHDDAWQALGWAGVSPIPSDDE